MIVLAGGHPEPENVEIPKDDAILDVTSELFDSTSLELLEETEWRYRSVRNCSSLVCPGEK